MVRTINDEILTLEEASRFLKLSKSTVYNLAQQKKIPANKIGRSWRFLRSYLITWLEHGAKIN
ncbi:MAG: helix-turn-helix domain-containing protein [Candidatus Omnitrophica bacterium]|nr:helix-turn-helix domain-containing protein [Candidatus Omnitrophota bacterium]